MLFEDLKIGDICRVARTDWSYFQCDDEGRVNYHKESFFKDNNVCVVKEKLTKYNFVIIVDLATQYQFIINTHWLLKLSTDHSTRPYLFSRN